MDRKSLPPEHTATEAAEQFFWISRAASMRAANPPRHSLRRRADLEVLVNHGLTYSMPWHVRDLSLDGAFIEMEAGPLPEATYLELVLRYRYKDRDIELRLPATVSRMVGHGMALRFGYYDDQTYTDLANLLYAR
jgi:hypothetical protein